MTRVSTPLMTLMFALIAAVTFAGTAFAEEACGPCKKRQTSNAEKACGASFGDGDYGGSTCTYCPDTNRVHVTCWKEGQNMGVLEYEGMHKVEAAPPARMVAP